jgi:uncharacterized membrane protein
MLELLPPLNDHNLPWMDTIHPIVVHFVIAMALIAFVFDVIGVVWRKPALFEASFWNLLFATGAIFVAIIFGQVEAGLASPYGASRHILDIHTTIGWSATFLGAGALVSSLIVVQMVLGDRLIWTYGLHTVKVVAAARAGLI